VIEDWVALVLAPLLIAQGRAARRAALVLSEAAGPRAGRQGGGNTALRVLVLGDSAAAGVGVTTQDEALAGQLVRALHAALPGTMIEWRLVARTGVNTRAALAMLRQESPERFDLAVVALGVNDVTAGARIARWLGAMAALVAELRANWGVREVFLSGLPPMRRFPLLPQPLRWYLGARARRFDAALAAWAQEREGLHHVALPDGSPAMIAPDGFHPGPAACALWARELARNIVAAQGVSMTGKT